MSTPVRTFPAVRPQGPLSRFGDTAANTGVLALLEDVDIPPAVKTIAASVGAGLFRIALMPVDATKTIMQASTHMGIFLLYFLFATGLLFFTVRRCIDARGRHTDRYASARARAHTHTHGHYLVSCFHNVFYPV